MGYGPDEPRNSAMALPDPVAAVSAAAAVVTALRRRAQTGQGAYVEMSLHEGCVALCGPWLIEHQLDGDIKRIGNRHPQMAPHGVYRCSGEDAWIAIACSNNADWQALCGAIESKLDPTMDLAHRRSAHDVIDAQISAWTEQHTKTHAAELLQAAGVAAGPVNTTPDMVADPQVAERGFFIPLEPGPTPMPGNPVKMSGLSSDDWTPCPRLGADNAAVLRDWLGYPDTKIKELEEADVLVDRPPA
jgi:crotonobetainyl-CoA:carnitine CoA-transferase CaiB-like acyl-CoA transferase